MYSYTSTSRLSLRKAKHLLSPSVRGLNSLHNIHHKRNLKTATGLKHTNYLLHPFFAMYVHRMLNKSLYLIGPNMSPYRYNLTNQVLHKIKSLLTLDSEDLLKYIIRLPASMTLTPQPTFYTHFLQTVKNYSFQQQTKVLNILSKYRNNNKILKYRTVFKNSRALVRAKKQVRPYLFLNTFQRPNTFANKTTLHKFLKLTTLTRFVKRRKARNFFRKRSLFKTNKRTLKSTLLNTSNMQNTQYPLYRSVIQSTLISKIKKPRFGYVKRRKKNRKRIFIRNKYATKLSYNTQTRTNCAYRLRCRPLRFLRKRPKLKAKHKMKKYRFTLFREQKRLHTYNVHTVKLAHKLRYMRGSQTIQTFRCNPHAFTVERVLRRSNLSLVLRTLFQRFLDRTLNTSFIYSKASQKAPLKIFTKTKKSFILQNIGVFILNNSRLFKLQYRFKFRFKKMYFSFLFPNQLKKSLMDKKKRIIISRFFLRRKLKTFSSLKFSFKTFKKKFKNFYNLKFFNTQGANTSHSAIHSYKNSAYDIVYRGDYLSKGIDFSAKIQEVFIRRIRFKPGYQRI